MIDHNVKPLVDARGVVKNYHVAGRAVDRATQLATGAGRVDQGDRHRLQRYRHVEDPRDLRRRHGQLGAVCRVAGDQGVVRRCDVRRDSDGTADGGAHGECEQGEAAEECARHRLSSPAVPRQQSNYTM